MESNAREPDRRKLRWILMGFTCYFLFMLYALPHASVFPSRVFALFGVLNFAIILSFVFSIRKVYMRMKGLTFSEGSEVDETTAKLRTDFDRRRLKWLWIGAGLYSLIFLNGLRFGFAYVGRLPLVVIVLGEIFNASILTVIILEIRKVYNQLERSKSRQS